VIHKDLPQLCEISSSQEVDALVDGIMAGEELVRPKHRPSLLQLLLRLYIETQTSGGSDVVPSSPTALYDTLDTPEGDQAFFSEAEAEQPGSFLIDASEVELIDLIGEGSTASVYLGKFRGNVIAVKEIFGFQEGFITAFQRELDVYVKVKHPHIIDFLGVISSSGPLQLCLEFCAGGSLWDLLYNKQDVSLAWWQRIVMLYDTATAVAHLHSFIPKVVHRDLKSLNVLLLQPVNGEHDEPNVKLCDFGFAREHDGAATMTKGAGTSHWMAPEVISGTEYTEMADTFSFAMIIYEVVCRRVPFMDEEPTSVPQIIKSGGRPWCKGLELKTEGGISAEIPPGLLSLMESCWVQDAHQRPTFEKIWQDLVEISRATSPELKCSAPGQLFCASHVC